MSTISRIVLAIVPAFYFSACAQLYDPIFDGYEPNITNYYNIAESESVELDGLTYSIDSKYEAYCVLQILTGNIELMVNGREHGDYDYYEAVMEYFSKYSGSEPVKKAKKLLRNNFSVDLAPALVQMLDSRLSVRGSMQTEKYESTFNGWRGCLFFIEIVQEFCNLTDFNAFYDENRAFYASLLNSYIVAQNSTYDLAALKGYFGYIEPNNTIILEPLHKIGNFGVRLESEADNTSECYIYIRPRKYIENIPVFFSSEGLNTLLHEFSHTYLNKLVDDNWEKLDFYSYMVNYYDHEKMGRLGYGNPPMWKTIMHEEFARAAAARLTYAFDRELGSIALQNDMANGFLLAEILNNGIITYENNRHCCPVYLI